MSYSNPYPYGDQYATTPSTPGSAHQVFTWDPQAQQPQAQPQAQEPQYPPPATTIHLHERAQLPPSSSVASYRGAVSSEHAAQPSAATLPAIDERDELGLDQRVAAHTRPASAPIGAAPGAAGPSAAGAPGPSRRPASRARARDVSHPYRRQSAAESSAPAMTRATSTQSAGGVVAAVHAHHHQPATATPSQPQRQSLRLRTAAEEVFRNLGPSRSIPCPGQTGRQEQEQVRARASVPPSATSTTSPQATVGVEAGGSGGVAGAAAASSLRRFVIRTDVHFDEGAGLMTAMLELPGIKKSDLSLVISTCPYTRVRQLTVAGRNQSVWPEGSLGWTVRERKFGTFSRMIVVPPETRADTVAAEMRDGILTLRIPIGQPMPRERPTAIPIA